MNVEWDIVAYRDTAITDIPEQGIIRRGDLQWNWAVLTEYPIYSVKRLEDGEIFTVGDWVRFDIPYYGNNCGRIKAFEFLGTELVARSASQEAIYGTIDCLQKVKEYPLTEEKCFKDEENKD